MEQSIESVADAVDFPTVIVRGMDDRMDDGIQSGRVTAAVLMAIRLKVFVVVFMVIRSKMVRRNHHARSSTTTDRGATSKFNPATACVAKSSRLVSTTQFQGPGC